MKLLRGIIPHMSCVGMQDKGPVRLSAFVQDELDQGDDSSSDSDSSSSSDEESDLSDSDSDS